MNTLRFPTVLLMTGKMSIPSNPALNPDALRQASPAFGRRLASRWACHLYLNVGLDLYYVHAYSHCHY